jgi:hypothetical protein
VISTTQSAMSGDLRFGGSVRQPHVGGDALGGEVPLGQLGVLTGDAHALAEGLRCAAPVSPRDCGDDLDRIRRCLAVAQLAEADDVAARLLDPVATGDPEIEQTLGDVHRDLLRPQDPDVGDARVVDRGLVVNG